MRFQQPGHTVTQTNPTSPDPLFWGLTPIMSAIADRMAFVERDDNVRQD